MREQPLPCASTMHNSVSKQTLRSNMKALLNDFFSLNEEDTNQQTFNTLTYKLIKNFEPFKNANTILAYYPMKNEPSCIEIIKNTLDDNKRLFLPRIDEEKMYFIYCNSIEEDQFNKNSYGILEPTGKDFFNTSRLTAGDSVFILVPGFAFTPSGKRLGRGKAYYDRFLKEILNCKARTNSSVDFTIVGLCYSFQICHDLPTESHDIIMDYVLCEKGLITCK